MTMTGYINSSMSVVNSAKMKKLALENSILSIEIMLGIGTNMSVQVMISKRRWCLPDLKQPTLITKLFIMASDYLLIMN